MKQLPPHQSTAGLAEELVQKIEHLVQLEKDLALQEVKELGIRNAIAAGMLATAALLGMLAILVAVPVLLVVLLSPHWLVAVIWIAVYLVLAAILGLVGKARIKVGVPPKTMRSLQETKDWALTQLKSNGR
jgi:VIT1/CCC1 family predicted Fe2+/Mn2+ transporter